MMSSKAEHRHQDAVKGSEHLLQGAMQREWVTNVEGPEFLMGLQAGVFKDKIMEKGCRV